MREALKALGEEEEPQNEEIKEDVEMKSDKLETSSPYEHISKQLETVSVPEQDNMEEID